MPARQSRCCEELRPLDHETSGHEQARTEPSHAIATELGSGYTGQGCGKASAAARRGCGKAGAAARRGRVGHHLLALLRTLMSPSAAVEAALAAFDDRI